MPDLSITIGTRVIPPLIWLIILAGFFSSFTIWRKLKDDYKEEEVYLFVTIVFLCIILLWLAGRFFGLGFISAFLGIILATFIWARGEKRNPWEVLDAFCIPLIYFFIFGGIGNFLKGYDFWELRFLVIGFIGLGYFFYAEKKYRSFSFYKSGKTGFLFWSTAVVLFFLLSIADILAFFGKTGLYWQSIFHLVIALVSVGIIYFRSERKLSEDFKMFKPR